MKVREGREGRRLGQVSDRRGGEEMADKKGYAGKIGNGGAQFVTAVHSQSKPADKSKILTGKDLRNGKKG